MSHSIPEVDQYIAKAPEFAQAIMSRLRELIHQASPDIQENIKWGVPSFELRGIVCGFAAFKKHVSLRFQHIPQMDDPLGLFKDLTPDCVSAVKFHNVDELPQGEALVGYFKQAIALNAKGVKVEKKPVTVEVPEYFSEALEQNPEARAAFDKMAPGYRREYIEWLVEAKREATRNKRMAQAIEWIAEGKTRNWKYKK